MEKNIRLNVLWASLALAEVKQEKQDEEAGGSSRSCAASGLSVNAEEQAACSSVGTAGDDPMIYTGISALALILVVFDCPSVHWMLVAFADPARFWLGIHALGAFDDLYAEIAGQMEMLKKAFVLRPSTRGQSNHHCFSLLF